MGEGPSQWGALPVDGQLAHWGTIRKDGHSTRDLRTGGRTPPKGACIPEKLNVEKETNTPRERSGVTARETGGLEGVEVDGDDLRSWIVLPVRPPGQVHRCEGRGFVLDHFLRERWVVELGVFDGESHAHPVSEEEAPHWRGPREGLEIDRTG